MVVSLRVENPESAINTMIQWPDWSIDYKMVLHGQFYEIITV